MQLFKVGMLTVAAGTLAFTAACGSAPQTTKAPQTDAAQTKAARTETAPIVLSDGSDRTGSLTANDWATYADHVLVVTVVAETRHAKVGKEVERGEGMIARTVKLRVDKVLWSAPDAPRAAPASLAMPAAGWLFNDRNKKPETKLGIRESSRIETGHTYVKAVEWLDDPCFDDPKKGRWDGLGSGDTIPFDQGVLGAGEFEGRVQTVGQLSTQWRTDAAGAQSLRAKAAGQPLTGLVAGLRAATPKQEEQLPQECDLSDR